MAVNAESWVIFAACYEWRSKMLWLAGQGQTLMLLNEVEDSEQTFPVNTAVSWMGFVALLCEATQIVHCNFNLWGG